MADPEVTVYVRDAALQRIIQVDDFDTLELTSRFNDVGTWQLTLDGRLPAAAALTSPWYGIEVSYGDVGTIFSGSAVVRGRRRNHSSYQATISGSSDEMWIPRRLASPQPATTYAPYNTNEHDVRSGVASTVLIAYANANLGPGATGARRIPPVVMNTDPVVGSSVTGRARWQPLLALLQELATAGGIGFQLRQSGTSLVFSAYQPTDRSTTVQFSLELGNLAGYDYEVTAPEATYALIGGDGEGTARTIIETYDPATLAAYGRNEVFIDRRDTTDPTEMTQAGQTHLVEHGEQAKLSITPIDTPQMMFGAQYNLGDQVTVIIDGAPVGEVVREVKLTLTPTGPRELVPVIGTPAAQDVLRLFRDVRALTNRTTNLERR